MWEAVEDKTDKARIAELEGERTERKGIERRKRFDRD